ncbi:RNA methylase, NOL1/NOP2/sun family [Sulfolobus islandicus Y.N.15.51]|jgi:NOL1/NOP2/sun family putative RNA methylase|uniref:RNA methylase, NOL1/NOP2/sun family n=1 Tax=Saccharolobus islandicus (strain Y.N.15.51 / Yellowstone \|nr:RsmB/NOP family class I SAM-dependent RNA methyltransferase [Sulfolobus islandicus]ACP48065.1 RNA methylase, NOL1/NOP2/sun family [Sulfolobus islandicus Y.N.15.51]
MENRIARYLSENANLFHISPSYKAKRLASKYGFLDYMIERYLNMFSSKEELEEYLNSCSFPLKKSIRCNTLRTDCKKLEEMMSEKGFILEKVKWLQHGYIIKRTPPMPSLGSTLEYLMGYYHIQGLASMVPAYVLNPSQDDFVLDMAAAPGGKTTQVSQIMQNKGLVVAVEKKRSRIRALLSNVNRLGAENVVLVKTDVLNLRRINKFQFDRILLDAPCSGEGLIQKDPTRRYKTTIDDLRDFAYSQLSLIEIAYELLKEGGYIVYSTCSVAPEENELIVNFAIEELGMKTMSVEGYPASNGYVEYYNTKFNIDVKNCLRFFPHTQGTEGFFLCLLKKE